MIRQHNQTVRTFFHSVASAVAIGCALAASGHWHWAGGFCIGAMVSLLSLLTLKISIPALFHKGASARSTALLQLLLIVKVPIYAVGLYYAAKMGAAAAFAAFGGCTVVPCVISLEAIVRACIEADPKLKRAMAMVEPVTLMPAVEELSRQVAALKAEAAEPMPMPAQPQVRPVREGAA